MTNKPMLSVERKVIEDILADAREPGDDYMAARKVLRALLDKPECSTCKGLGVVDDGELTHSAGGIPYECGPIKCVKDCPDCRKPAARHQAGPVALQHMAVSEGGVLRWMTGRKMQDCELYAMPDGSAIRSKLYAEQPSSVSLDLACDRAYRNGLQRGFGLGENGQIDQYHKEFDAYQREILKAGKEQPAPVAVVMPERYSLAMFQMISGFESVTPEQFDLVWSACRTEVARLNGVKP